MLALTRYAQVNAHFHHPLKCSCFAVVRLPHLRRPDPGKLRLRAWPPDLLREAAALGFEDSAALTLAYYGYIRALQLGGPSGVNAFAGIEIGHDIIETNFGSFASTPNKLRPRSTPTRDHGRCCRSWNGPCCGSAR